MKKIVFALLMISICSTPFSLQAEEVDESLLEQLPAISSYLARTFRQTKELTDAELRDSITAGAGWMTKSQEPNGHFRYEYTPYEDTYSTDDNIVRQTGALYILGELFRESQNDSLKLGTPITRAITYFEGLTRHEEDTAIACIRATEVSSRCQLGATSLALIGLLSYVEEMPAKERTYAELISGYGAFILGQQKENGGFRNGYRFGVRTQAEAESPFSNGEALLALVRLYHFNPSGEVKEAILQAFTYLKAQPFDANLYLWIMAALKDADGILEKDTYTTYVNDFTSWRIDGSKASSGPIRNYCGYAEGLASAVSILQNSPTVDVTGFKKELHTLNARHVFVQLTERDKVRVLREDGTLILRTLPKPVRALGGFIVSDTEPTQRIDVTQHCLGAYVHTLVDINGEQL